MPVVSSGWHSCGCDPTHSGIKLGLGVRGGHLLLLDDGLGRLRGLLGLLLGLLALLLSSLELAAVSLARNSPEPDKGTCRRVSRRGTDGQ